MSFVLFSEAHRLRGQNGDAPQTHVIFSWRAFVHVYPGGFVTPNLAHAIPSSANPVQSICQTFARPRSLSAKPGRFRPNLAEFGRTSRPTLRRNGPPTSCGQVRTNVGREIGRVWPKLAQRLYQSWSIPGQLLSALVQFGGNRSKFGVTFCRIRADFAQAGSNSGEIGPTLNHSGSQIRPRSVDVAPKLAGSGA